MPTTRSRRIVRRAVMALGAVVIFLWGAWAIIGDPTEIERSRAIRLGMLELDVQEAMGGRPTTATMTPSTGEMVLYFGEPTYLIDLKWRVAAWMGFRTDPRLDNYLVRVQLDPN